MELSDRLYEKIRNLECEKIVLERAVVSLTGAYSDWALNVSDDTENSINEILDHIETR